MRSVVTLLVLTLVITLCGTSGVGHATAGPGQMAAAPGGELNPRQIKVGEPAPLFSLEAVVSLEDGKEFKKINLIDYRGKWVVLFFYPLDFTTVCPTEIRAFNGAVGEFRKLNAEILGASVDSKFSHLAWLKSGALGTFSYPLLSDFNKDTARKYGILNEKEGMSLRGLFIIDPEGILQYQVVHNLSVGRSIEETLRVLEALQTGELCPIGWKPGQKTLGR